MRDILRQTWVAEMLSKPQNTFWKTRLQISTHCGQRLGIRTAATWTTVTRISLKTSWKCCLKWLVHQVRSHTSFLALHPCATRTTATLGNAFYASHKSYQIHFCKSRCGMYRSYRATVVKYVCSTIILLQHSAAQVSCNVAVAAI